MIKLINRGKYDKAIQDEFEHLTNRLSTFLGQIFDEDGVYIPPDGGDSNLQQIVSAVKRVKVGDLFISNGNAIGYSSLPWAVDVNKTLIVMNGGIGAANATYAMTWNGSSNIQLKGMRTGTLTIDATIYYCVVEYW